MHGRTAVLFCIILSITNNAFAAEPEIPWYRDPGTLVTFKASHFVFKTRLPRGWSTTDAGVVPPAAFAASCDVRLEVYADRKWNEFLVAALESGDVVRASREKRAAFKIDGNTAVSSRATRDEHLTTHVYIDLSTLVPGSAVAWTFNGDPSESGRTCEDQFLALVRSCLIAVE